MVTGTGLRVLEEPDVLSKGSFLYTTNFYDSKGRVIQLQYDFSGKPVGTELIHSYPASTEGTLQLRTLLYYDHGGETKENRQRDNTA
jgi:hypothetical protein